MRGRARRRYRRRMARVRWLWTGTVVVVIEVDLAGWNRVLEDLAQGLAQWSHSDSIQQHVESFR